MAMSTSPQPFLLAGQWLSSNDHLDVHSPWDNSRVGTVCRAQADHLQQAVAAAHAARPTLAKLAVYERANILRGISERIASRREEIAQLIRAESGKPITFARAEADRAVITFSFAADLLRTQTQPVQPLDMAPKNAGRIGLVQRFPVGPVLGITPFNFPLNLVAHKVAPAIMAGNPLILKPASYTPLTALLLGEILLASGLPAAAVSILPFSARLSAPLLADDRIKMISFTGSDVVGWDLKAQSAKKKTALELGGDAAAVIDQTADLDLAAQKCAAGAFAYAGQVCISVQRVIVHEAVHDLFLEKFLKAVDDIVTGDPRDEATLNGPLISEEDQQRTHDWVQEAVDGGAELLRGGQKLDNNCYAPTVLRNLPAGCKLDTEEAFAPVVMVERATDMEAAFKQVNRSRFGLQTGIFTDSQHTLRRALAELEVGGIIVNDAPTLRIDPMPYGGVKDSGFGREGLAWAYEEMTEPRVLVW